MMITSLLDTDLYKFTMMQVVLHRFPDVEVEYQLFIRTPDVNLRPFVGEIKQHIEELCGLSLQPDELSYLSSLGYFSDDFIDYLSQFRFDKRAVQIDDSDGVKLTIRGPWLKTILFEVPLLAIISEVIAGSHDLTIARERLQAKIDDVKQHTDKHFQFSDFGTRRRFSKQWQGELIAVLKQQLPDNFIGTSNVYFAKNLALTPIGTMAHEYMQAFQVLAPSIRESQQLALTIWLQHYPNQLGIALADTINLASFLKEFDKTLAEQYQGIRQDSGDLSVLGEQVIQHYNNLGIDARKKKLVMSGNLTIKKSIALHQQFYGRIIPLFGIGTHLTNDVGGKKPLDMVIKMVMCNSLPVAKITDDYHKAICLDPDYLHMLKQLYRVE